MVKINKLRPKTLKVVDERWSTLINNGSNDINVYLNVIKIKWHIPHNQHSHFPNLLMISPLTTFQKPIIGDVHVMLFILKKSKCYQLTHRWKVNGNTCFKERIQTMIINTYMRRNIIFFQRKLGHYVAIVHVRWNCVQISY